LTASQKFNGQLFRTALLSERYSTEKKRQI